MHICLYTPYAHYTGVSAIVAREILIKPSLGKSDDDSDDKGSNIK